MVYKINKRYVKNIDGLRVFQKQAVNKILNPKSQILFIEAPVGSGKSYIIRNLLKKFPENEWNRIVLTFPTRILMDAQLKALKEDLKADGYTASFWEGTGPFKEADLAQKQQHSKSV